MKHLAPLKGRWVSLAMVWAVEVTLGVALGGIMASPVVRALGHHPDGARAIYGLGGRLALDVLHRQRMALETGIAAVALGLGVWALTWLVLGGVLPGLMATEEAPSLHKALADSLRRAPTLAALAAMAGIGYALAGLAAWFGHDHAVRRAAGMVNVRSADLQTVWGVLPALAIAAMVTVWHDAARTQAMAQGSGSGAAASGALLRLVKSPVRGFGTAGLWALAGWLGPLVALVGSSVLGGREGAALVALIALQQLAVGWRLVCRALWFAWLAAPWRDGREARA